MSSATNPGSVEFADRRFVGFYSTILLLLFNIATAGVFGVSVTFVLKDQLHLQPITVANFGFLTDTPYMVGFAFGFLRDRWRPFGQGDRGYFLATPLLMAAVLLWLGTGTSSYYQLMAGMIVFSVLASILGASAQGLISAIAKDSGMTGRLGAVTLLATRGVAALSYSVSGWLGEHASHQAPFIVSAVIALPMMAMAFWRPRSIFRSQQEVFVSVVPEGALAALGRLSRHRAVLIPAAVLFLFEFAPGWGTPLMFYLTNKIHLSETEFGNCLSVIRIGTVVAALAYTWLCLHFRFRPLLSLGTLLAVIGAPAFLLIHSPTQAYIVSLFAGLSCGIALASYFDLLVRSCPKELEGVAFMTATAAMVFAGDISDIFGSWLYEKGGFMLALAISTAFTALIFVPLLLVPKSIEAPLEGERIVDADPPVAPALT